jgi:hypothetical protein
VTLRRRLLLPALGLGLNLILTGLAWSKPPLQGDPPPVPDPPEASRPAHPTPGQVVHPPQSDPLPGVGNFQRLPSIDETRDVVVVTRKKPYWKAGTFDPALSNACALGDFVTAEFNRMVAKFTDPTGTAVLQVVVPTHRHLLYDKRKLAKPGQTYFFLNNNLPTCKVWIEGKVQPRVLDPARGTSVPPPPANALKKKLKEISSWPKQ